MAEDSENRLVFINGKAEKFTWQDLMNSDAMLISEGNLGNTYKAYMNFGGVVAVKRLNGDFARGIGDENLRKLGEICHENLLPFKAYMLSEDEQILIYDYMHKGSLYSRLHGKGNISLNWESRMKIVYDVALGVEHIHIQGPTFCHGNIRSSNVFLTGAYVAKVSEFGIAQLLPEEGNISLSSLSSEYLAPEIKYTKKVCQQTDIYSFGVLLLELCTGKDLVKAHSIEEGFNLAKWVRLMFQEKEIIYVIDEGLRGYKEKVTGKQMVQMLELAICCTFENPNKRPSISKVIKRIEEVCGV